MILEGLLAGTNWRPVLFIFSMCSIFGSPYSSRWKPKASHDKWGNVSTMLSSCWSYRLEQAWPRRRAGARSQHIQKLCVMHQPSSSIQHFGKQGGLSLSLSWRLFERFVTYSGNLKYALVLPFCRFLPHPTTLTNARLKISPSRSIHRKSLVWW